MIWNVIGFIAMVAGSTYALFQLLKVSKDPHSINALSRKFLLVWSIDKICSLALMIHLLNIPMFLKYLFSAVIVLIMCYKKFTYKPNPVDKNQDFM